MEKATENLESQVKEIISKQLMVDQEEVTRNTSFVEDLGADSLDTVEMIMEFEDEFNMKIPDEEAEQLTTVGEALDYLEDNLE